MKQENTHTWKLSAVFSFIDQWGLLAIAGFLLAFIPLYPKLPLADILPGYIVRLRIEDLLIAGASVLWFIQVFRKKISLHTPLTWIVGAYLVAGFLSSLSAIYWTKTVPMSEPHILKMFLHYGRRIEYFSLFFITFSAIQTKNQVKKFLAIFVISTALVGIYGLGQKYLYWPVYSTMNREFSKGLRLYLTEHARVQSTFGGHYDYAAFLVIGLPLILSLLFFVKNKKLKLGLAGTFLISLWGMMMTSSRSSFLAYLAALTTILVLFTIRKGLIWGVTRMVICYVVTAFFLMIFGDLLLRFGQIFKDNSAYTALQNTVNEAKERAQTPLVEKPKDAISIDDVARAAAEAAKREKVIDKTDTLPTPVAPVEKTLPPDVFEDIPDRVIATTSAEGKEIEVVIPRVFSENAHRLGLSAAIRLDTLWPFAIRGFLRNPLLGSGYSTLTKYTRDQFTEAESTDNDFLRTLGETGLLGFLTFYGTMVIAVGYLWRKTKVSKDELLYLFAVVHTAITIGLMINAIYIDVFVSSKVIQTYWILTGMMLAYAKMFSKTNEKKEVERRTFKKKVRA